MRHAVDAVIDTASVLNILHAKRHQSRSTFRCQGANGLNAAQAVGQHRIQSILLLVAQNSKLTEIFTTYGQKRFGVGVQLLQRVRDMDERDIGKDHALVACTQVV